MSQTIPDVSTDIDSYYPGRLMTLFESFPEPGVPKKACLSILITYCVFITAQVDSCTVLSGHSKTQSDVHVRHMSDFLSHRVPANPAAILQGQQQRVQIRGAHRQPKQHRQLTGIRHLGKQLW